MCCVISAYPVLSITSCLGQWLGKIANTRKEIGLRDFRIIYHELVAFNGTEEKLTPSLSGWASVLLPTSQKFVLVAIYRMP